MGKVVSLEELRSRVCEALKEGKPAILRLPVSFQYPYGHYVVVKGFLKNLPSKENKQTTREMWVVNDPQIGERVLALKVEKGNTMRDLLQSMKLDEHGISVLISEKATILR